MPRYKHNHRQRPRPFKQSVKRLHQPYNQASRKPEANKYNQLRKIKLEQQSEVRRIERLEAEREQELAVQAQEHAVREQERAQWRARGNILLQYMGTGWNRIDQEPRHAYPDIDINITDGLLYYRLPTYLERDEIWERPRQYPNRRSVYDDGHNVHVRSVVDSVRESLLNLRADPEPDCNSVIDQIASSNLTDRTKQLLTKFCSESYEHSIFGMTISQLFAYVWQRIQNHDSVLELEEILEERVSDCIDCYGNEVCFTGRFNRILSTLDGFCPDIRITISDNERITAIFLQARAGLNPYDPDTHKTIATKNLLEAGFTLDQFKPWIDELDVGIWI